MKMYSYALACCSIIAAAGCTSIPQDALRLSPTSLEDRQMQSRRYETTDEARILSACAGLMQDMGFNLDESESDLGIIVGSKQRSAASAAQVTTAVALAVLTGAYMPTDDQQTMRCCIATSPHGSAHIAVRVTFQRMVWDTEGNCTRREGIKNPEIYLEFFDRLSKAVFLEGQEI